MDRWQRLQSLFEAAAQQPPSEWAGFLTAHETDPRLRAEVLALLQADAGTSDAVDALVGRVSGTLDAIAAAPGLRVGPWQLLDELGAGGMGTVFRAERADGAYERVVAIKFLRGIATREGAERMRRERQFLANLQHPGIASLIDGGSTAEGQPYLVMDHVDGVPITDHARGQTLEVRLRLIQQVAEAVHHAHQHLIIHRDLKPANVLVGRDGRPILLDFGIAKLLDDEASSASATRAWFTPGYASPEQLRGEPVSTATDIHALGQLLAEVLGGGHLPPDARGRVVPPSARGITDIPRRRLRELDSIVARACASRPHRRYPSAEALAADIERFFRHQPLVAAPAGPLYLAGKFLRRRRVAVAFASAALIALSVFTWRLVAERDRAVRAEIAAQQESATAERVIAYLVSLFDAASPEQAGNQPLLPHELVDRGRQRLGLELAGYPWQQARLLGVLATIDSRLGRSELAAQSLGEAIAIERSLAQPLRLAALLVQYGILENQNERPGNADQALSEALALIVEHGGEPDLRIEALGTLALAQSRLGQSGPARRHAEQALALIEALGDDPKPDGRSVSESSRPDFEPAALVCTDCPGGDQRTLLKIETLQAYAEVLSRSGESERALEPARDAVELIKRRFPDDSFLLARAQGFLANVHVALENYPEAEVLFARMLDLRLHNLDPGSAWAVTARNNLAQTIYAQGRILDALPLMQENLDLLRARGEQQTPSYAVIINNLASLHELTGNYQKSIPLFREALDLLVAAGSAVASDPRQFMYRQNLGRSLMLAGDLDAAWPLLAEAIDAIDADAFIIERGRQALHLGEWLRRTGRFDEVKERLDQAEHLFASVLPPAHPRQAAVLRARASLAMDQGSPDAAESLLRPALTIYEGAFGEQHPNVIETRVALAQVLLLLQRGGEARTLVASCREHARRLYVAEAPIHAEIERIVTG